MRIYMMERFLERIAISTYQDSFIIKCGMLVTSLVGVSMCSTMDIDTSIKGQELSLENAKSIINEINSVVYMQKRSLYVLKRSVTPEGNPAL